MHLQMTHYFLKIYHLCKEKYFKTFTKWPRNYITQNVFTVIKISWCFTDLTSDRERSKRWRAYKSVKTVNMKHFANSICLIIGGGHQCSDSGRIIAQNPPRKIEVLARSPEFYQQKFENESELKIFVRVWEARSLWSTVYSSRLSIREIWIDCQNLKVLIGFGPSGLYL